MDKSNAKSRIEEKTKSSTNQMQNHREKKNQIDGQIKCKIIDRRKATRWTNRIQKHR
jgi:hypothetical protein